MDFLKYADFIAEGVIEVIPQGDGGRLYRLIEPVTDPEAAQHCP